MDDNVNQKPYILAILDKEVVPPKENIQKFILKDFYFLALLSYDFPLLPLTIMFELDRNSEIFKCISLMIENDEIHLLSKYNDLTDFSFEQKTNFSKSGNFSLLHSKEYHEYLRSINPILRTKRISTTQFIESEMQWEGFSPVAGKLQQSRIYNKARIIYPIVDDLKEILDTRKNQAIIQETFKPILNNSAYEPPLRKYVFKSVTEYNNNLYYRNYCRVYDAIIPIGLESIKLGFGNVEYMNNDIAYKAASNNIYYWRQLFNSLKIYDIDCTLLIKLRKTPSFIEHINKIKKLFDKKIPFSPVLEMGTINILHYFKFPLIVSEQKGTVAEVIESLSLFCDLNKDIIEKNNIMQKEVKMEINISGDMNGDILKDSTKNVSKVDEIINIIQQDNSIHNKQEIIENIQKYSNDKNKLSEYLSTLGNIGSIAGAIASLLA